MGTPRTAWRSTIVEDGDGGRRRSPDPAMLPDRAAYVVLPGGRVVPLPGRQVLRSLASPWPVVSSGDVRQIRRWDPHTPPPAMLPGLGALDPGTAQIANLASQGAAMTGVILSGLAAPSIAALSPAFAAAGPIGMAAAALIQIGFLIAGKFSGCGQTCVQASNIANQVGDYLTQNLNTYMAAPVHYRSLQLAALNNFDFGWTALAKACGDPALQAAGVNCIADRQRGACKWRDAGGQCWNWFSGMRDPIANDPNVVPDPTPVGSAVSSLASLFSSGGSGPGGGVTLADWMLPAALIGAGLLL